LSDTLDTIPAELIPLVKEFGFEGIVAKRKDSCYEIGKRTGAWLKYKVSKAQEFVIGGYTPDNPLDALIGGYKAISSSWPVRFGMDSCFA
jgi:ATP-dependent DNA ligase